MLKDKKILIMGIRNKWSIAYGAAKSAYDQGAQLYFTYMGEENKGKIEELIAEFEGAKAFECDVSDEQKVESLFQMIKDTYGSLDAIVHCIAHANTQDLRGEFINTSKEGFTHANEVSAYSLVLIARKAKELELLHEGGSIVCLTYHGSTKVFPGYNVMGVAKAALEASVRYLASNLGKDGIRVNAVSAGPIKTLSAKGIQNFSSILDVVENNAPLKKNVTTIEVGNVISFLCSSLSSCITGQVVYADNGYSIMGI